MANNVREFERAFATYVGAPFAVMCNSGSSANLLALAALTNHHRSKKLSVITMGWSGARMLVDESVADHTDGSRSSLRGRGRGHHERGFGRLGSANHKQDARLSWVHVLDCERHMDRLMKICTVHDLLLVEDTCESLGSTYGGKCVGTFGSFGSYSLYRKSHHDGGRRHGCVSDRKRTPISYGA